MSRRAVPRPAPWPVRILKFVVALLSACVLLSVIAVLPLRWWSPPTTAFMLQDDSGRKPVLQHWVDWKQIGTAMPLAVVAAEDQRFADHHGIDLGSIRASLAAARSGARLRGASTITQQLVKNLYLSPSRSLWRKGLEAWLALVAEACLGKQRILELYLNVVQFGPGIYGVDAASRHFFRSRPDALSDPQAALLAAVLPNPVGLHAERPSSYVRKRQAWIQEHLRRLRREQWITRITPHG